jgi:DNA-binding response OmpR family regulator
MDTAVKKAFHPLDLARGCCARDRGREEPELSQPRLLLIDDEPALATFLADAARGCRFEPVITSDDAEFREEFLAMQPDMVALDLGMPGMDGVELLRFLAKQNYHAPVLIVSGFDRRVLESAFRLGEALGLAMAGPVEKPVRLQDLEAVLNQLRTTLDS